ncbi:hypothetical protein A3I18_00295 [Candidatus Campbellbacteria bacterium RIFCSPLOWO2_02_FULL_35_11]|uniref:Uncharacterized protein n=1 Tax=Candidatus Campbellbacteria bacterium RIFCSPLOWO2_02_FULL_35_11 TaxID=1797581 RepID=A0A1F5ETE4_9BACT|nr:MAG: hypothetical protein A3I18_00295 [Candidatus Campbellbacteria bacterium RIFCSPLOWO2_02_FULL_35_11]
MFNEHHPELEEGEEFLTNATALEFHKIICASKRLGDQAYNTEGNPIDFGLRPVFKKEGDHHDFNSGHSKYIHDDEPFR